MTVSQEDIAKAIRFVISEKLSEWRGVSGAFFTFEEFRDQLVADGLLHDTATIRSRFRAFCTLGVFEPVNSNVKYGKVWISLSKWNLRFPSIRLIEPLLPCEREREREREGGKCQTFLEVRP